jgi:hypothetical protein
MKQTSKILEEVNYDNKKIRLVKCIGAHNEADWIEYVLANNYDEFDQIRIVEGAVEGRPNSTPDGHSTDATIELIQKFPDPQNKIELYQMRRHFKSLEEQKQIFLDTSRDGDWLFIVDADEFYLEGSIAKARQAILRHPMASELIPTFLHFYRDFRHIRDYGDEWVLNHQRIIRYRPGMRYHTHPVATLPDGTCTYFSPGIQDQRYFLPLFIYHYGHAKGPEFHAMKREFYMNELAKYPAGEGKHAGQAFDEKFIEFVNYSENLAQILEFDGPHPKVLDNHPARNKLDAFYADKQIKNYRQADYYKEWPNLPNIPQWMWSKSKHGHKMKPVFNLLEV